MTAALRLDPQKPFLPSGSNPTEASPQPKTNIETRTESAWVRIKKVVFSGEALDVVDAVGGPSLLMLAIASGSWPISIVSGACGLCFIYDRIRAVDRLEEETIRSYANHYPFVPPCACAGGAGL